MTKVQGGSVAPGLWVHKERKGVTKTDMIKFLLFMMPWVVLLKVDKMEQDCMGARQGIMLVRPSSQSWRQGHSVGVEVLIQIRAVLKHQDMGGDGTLLGTFTLSCIR